MRRRRRRPKNKSPLTPYKRTRSSHPHNTMQPINQIGRPHQRTFSITPRPTSPLEGPLLVSVEFEVHGETQGTLFLKYAREMCDKLGLKGWIRASRRLTVIGEIQGPKDRIDEMALWLRLQGSPGSRIDHTDFSKWQIIDRLDYKTFSIRF